MLFAPFAGLVLFAAPDDVFAAPVVPVAGVGAASVVLLLLPLPLPLLLLLPLVPVFDVDVGGGAVSDIVLFVHDCPCS